MQISLECSEDLTYREQIDVVSLTYDCRAAAFEMQASGYSIPSGKTFRPARLQARGSELVVTFKTSEEMRRFSEWLKTAASEAKRSFDSLFEY